jgi:uncharacterized damage-inducible protein DinB
MDSEIAQLFLTHSTKQLRQMSGYIAPCLAKLTGDEIWSRDSPHANSIGNLILHLCGNVRQWIGAGVGGEEDIRDRASEFSAGGGFAAADLISHLNQTVDHAIKIIDAVTAERLVDEINPQNRRVSVLEAIYQVVGHFQQHTGQIIFATKIFAGEDLGLYRP